MNLGKIKGNKTPLIFLSIFFILIFSVNSLDFNETFDNSLSLNNMSNLEDYVYGQNIYSNTYTGSQGTYYLFRKQIPTLPQAGEGTTTYNIDTLSETSSNGLIVTASSYYYFGMQYNFNDDIIFDKNDTIFNIYRNMTGPAIKRPIIIFMDSSNQCRLHGEIGGTHVNLNLLKDGICSEDNSTYSGYEYSFIPTSAGSFNAEMNLSSMSNDTITVDKMFILMGVASSALASELKLDNVAITNYKNATNFLPNGTFEVEEYMKCLNETTDSSTFDFNISFSDNENDEIYYSIETDVTATELREFDFGFQALGFLISNNQYIENFKDVSNTSCEIHENNLFPQQSRLVTNYNHFSNSDYFILLTNTCDGDNMAYFELDKSYNVLESEINIQDIEVNETLILYYYDYDLNEIMNLKIFHNDTGNFTFESYYNDQYNYEFEQPYFDKFKIKLVPTVSDKSMVDIYLLNWSEPIELNLYQDIQINGNLENEYVNYIGFNYTESDILIESIRYRGFFEEPVFATDVPTSQIFYSKGPKNIELYVTDDFHLNTEYDTYNLVINVKDDKYCQELYDLDDNEDVSATIKSVVGSPFIDFLKANNVYEIGKYILWITYIGLIFVLIGSTFFTMGKLPLFEIMFFSGSIHLFIAWLINYVTEFIILLLLTVLSLTFIIFKRTMGSEYGG